MEYFVTCRIDDEKGYSVPYKIILYSDIKNDEENRSFLYQDLYNQLRIKIQNDKDSIDFKYFHIESIEKINYK